MGNVNIKEKRSGIRVALLSETLHYQVEGVTFCAEVGDITKEGMFLKTSDLLPPRSRLKVILQLPGDLGVLPVDAQVVRVNWAKNPKKGREHLGFGVSFQTLSEGTQKILDAYVVYLRNKQIISVSKRIIEEFFGPRGPKKF